MINQKVCMKVKIEGKTRRKRTKMAKNGKMPKTNASLLRAMALSNDGVFDGFRLGHFSIFCPFCPFPSFFFSSQF